MLLDSAFYSEQYNTKNNVEVAYCIKLCNCGFIRKNILLCFQENNITDPMPLILAENGRRVKDAKAKSSQTNFYRSLGKNCAFLAQFKFSIKHKTYSE